MNDDVIKSYKIKHQITKDTGVVNRKVDLSTQYDTCVLVFIGDWHIGTVDFDIEEASRVIDYVIKTPNARLFCLGDMMNTAILNSVSNMFEDIAYPQEQWKVFVSLLQEVASMKKLVVTHTGNHERRVGRNTGIDPVEQATAALGAKETYAPYFADSIINLKCPYTKSGTYSFPLVTHHGDSGNPENNSNINQESLVNAIGHTHTFKAYIKTKIIINKKGQRAKKDELNIVIPASGGGQYGYEKGYKPLNKCPYYAIEATPVINPLYDQNNKYNLEQPVILATKSIPILHQAPTSLKEKCIKESNSVIEKNIKNAKSYICVKYMEILDILEKCGMEINSELKGTLTKIILEENRKAKKQQVTPKKVENHNWYNHEKDL